MALEHFRMLINDFFSKYQDIVPEKAPLIILDSKSDVCMANNGKDTKHKRNIPRRIHLVRNGVKCKIHKIDCCEGVMQLYSLFSSSSLSKIVGVS